MGSDGFVHGASKLSAAAEETAPSERAGSPERVPPSKSDRGAGENQAARCIGAGQEPAVDATISVVSPSGAAQHASSATGLAVVVVDVADTKETMAHKSSRGLRTLYVRIRRRRTLLKWTMTRPCVPKPLRQCCNERCGWIIRWIAGQSAEKKPLHWPNSSSWSLMSSIGTSSSFMSPLLRAASASSRSFLACT